MIHVFPFDRTFQVIIGSNTDHDHISIINRNTSVSTWLKMITSDNVDDKDDAFDDGKALVAYKGCSQLKRLRPLARRDISDHNT